jgi:hypothetical protein
MKGSIFFLHCFERLVEFKVELLRAAKAILETGKRASVWRDLQGKLAKMPTGTAGPRDRVHRLLTPCLPESFSTATRSKWCLFTTEQSGRNI